jgi:hypothetical protein
MGFAVGVLIGVSLAGYFLGAFNPQQLNRSNAGLNCPRLQETPSPGQQPVTAGGRALALAEEQASEQSPPR